MMITTIPYRGLSRDAQKLFAAIAEHWVNTGHYEVREKGDALAELEKAGYVSVSGISGIFATQTEEGIDSYLGL